jgi:four helix bundle protein
MATFTSFTEINAWTKARELSRLIFEASSKGTFARDFGLKDQINRAAGSIMDNIAEGFERGSKNEFVNALTYSKGSAGETLSQLYRAFDRKHITDGHFQKLKADTEEISKMLNGLIRYLNTSTTAGFKFKDRK